MKYNQLGLLAFVFAVLSVQIQAAPIKPNPGEGKYKFCQRMYDGCIDKVIGKPGSQSYNVGKAKCRNKWNTCRKTGSWPAVIGFNQAFDSQYFYGLGADVEVDLSDDDEYLD